MEIECGKYIVFDVVSEDLTYGFVLEINNGTIIETKHNVIANATELSEDEILTLRLHEVELLHRTISQLTYPTLYDEDGNLKPMGEPEPEDKKKV